MKIGERMKEKMQIRRKQVKIKKHKILDAEREQTEAKPRSKSKRTETNAPNDTDPLTTAAAGCTVPGVGTLLGVPEACWDSGCCGATSVGVVEVEADFWGNND